MDQQQEQQEQQEQQNLSYICFKNLSEACNLGLVDKVRQCLNDPNLASVDQDGTSDEYGTALKRATINDHIEVVRLLLSDNRYANNTAWVNYSLNLAVYRNNLDMVKLLVEMGGADINYRINNCDTECTGIIRKVIHDGKVPIISYMLSKPHLVVDTFDVYGIITGLFTKQDRDALFKHMLLTHSIDFSHDIDDDIKQFRLYLKPNGYDPIGVRFYNHDYSRGHYRHDVKTMIKEYTPLLEYRNNKHKTLTSWRMELAKKDFTTYLQVRDLPHCLQSTNQQQKQQQHQQHDQKQRFFSILLKLNEDVIQIILNLRHSCCKEYILHLFDN